MAHTATLEKIGFFFPIGNTPPTCFTQNLSPEIDAEVLLLGCGDPRSILYTLHAGLDSATSRKLDFTCCDLEPAVLARNILLLTLIADSNPPSVIWRIFYHFFLDEDALRLLLAQCKLLINYSNNLTAWNASKYGRFLRFCSAQTLTDVRRMWEQYVLVENMSTTELQALKKTFTSRMRAVRTENVQAKYDIQTARAAAVFGLVKGVTEAGDRAFKIYWSTGVTPLKSKKIPPFPHLNPLFAYTRFGAGFKTHPMLHPIAAFHLGRSVANSPKKVSAEDLTEAAMDQFADWCEHFHHRIHNSSTITIRFFSGDALAFCRALQQNRMDGTLNVALPFHSWTATEIHFNETDYVRASESPAPTTFNVVDTSNLTDSLGLLNLLIAASPLLQRNPWSILHTNTLAQLTPGQPLPASLSFRLLSDVSTFSLLIGLTPTSYLYHYTSASHDDDEIRSFTTAQSGAEQFHQFISWRFASSVVPRSKSSQDQLGQQAPRLLFDEQALGLFLRLFYGRMFLEAHPITRGSEVIDHRRTEMNVVNYTPATFVGFLLILRSHLHVDWKKTMDHFFSHTPAVRTPFDIEFEELTCGLHTCGLYTSIKLRPDFIEQNRHQSDIFKSWKEIPAVVTIFLKTPRQALKDIENTDPMEESRAPAFMCRITGLQEDFEFSSLALAFGDMTVTGDDEEAVVHIQEDPAGWQGESSVIVSFDVPSWVLMQRASISLWLCPMLSETVLQGFLRHLMIHQSHIQDRQSVWVVQRRTQISYPSCLTTTTKFLETASCPVRIAFDSKNEKVVSMTIREDIQDAEAAQSLSEGAVVASHVVSDIAILVSFKRYSKILLYPLPVLSEQTKTRIARKSSYLEVIAPIRSDFEDTLQTTLSVNPFPIAQGANAMNLLTVHYVKLDALPIVDTPMSNGAGYCLEHHLELMKSEQEGGVPLDRMTWEGRPVLLGLKHQISLLFREWTGRASKQQEHPKDVLCLVADTVGLFGVIFVNEVRVDDAAQTLVLDAAVIPVTKRNVQFVEEGLNSVLGRLATTVSTSDEDLLAWRSLLPIFMERCRTWQHSSHCEWRKSGIPVSEARVEAQNLTNPLCNCGAGRDLGGFGSLSKWKELRHLATRAAISPIFSYSLHSETWKMFKQKLEAVNNAVTNDVPPNVHPKKACAQCSESKSRLKECAGCEQARYCSRVCQKLHWQGVHRAQCVAFN